MYAPTEVRALFGGVQKIYQFNNTYGASVIRHNGSYGHDDDLWELAVLKFNEAGGWVLTYETTITDDVLGYLTDENVEEILKAIERLPKPERSN